MKSFGRYKGILATGLVALALVGCGSDDKTEENPDAAATGGAGGSGGTAGSGGAGGKGGSGGGTGGTAGSGGVGGKGGSGGSGGSGGTAGSGGAGGAGGTGGSGGGTGGAGGAGGNRADGGAPDGGTSDTGPKPPVTAATTCTFVTDPTKAITVAQGREVLCALDIGSNNAKLIVMSMEKGKFDTLKDERQCRNRLGLGAKSFDSKAMKAQALAKADIDDLVLVMKQFIDVCKLDKGTMVGAEATQWARDATNIADVKAAIMTETKLALEVLTPEQEGTYGYSAGTYGRKGKLALDPGSNSFQFSWQLEADAAPKSISLPFGYVRSAANFFANPDIKTFEAARTMFEDKVKADLDAALKVQKTSLADVKAAVAGGKLSKEIYIIGQDGAIYLAVSGALKPGGTWITEQAKYDELVKAQKTMDNPLPMGAGQISAIIMPPALTAYLGDIKMADFETLRAAPVRAIYGEKALGNTTLLNLLAREIGITSFVLVPQEMPMGYIIAKTMK